MGLRSAVDQFAEISEEACLKMDEDEIQIDGIEVIDLVEEECDKEGDLLVQNIHLPHMDPNED